MIDLKPCPFCGSDVSIISYTQEISAPGVRYDMLEIRCPNCGDFRLSNDLYHGMRRFKTCYDIWNTRVREVCKYEVY